MRGATRICRSDKSYFIISIHAPRAGSDAAARGAQRRPPISIHAPRAGSDRGMAGLSSARLRFQSTLPVRGATSYRTHLPFIPDLFQSTLPVRGATMYIINYKNGITISIHAPRAGSDSHGPETASSWRRYFNPRSPCGERRQLRPHAARPGLYFNPHSPCGERQ